MDTHARFKISKIHEIVRTSHGRVIGRILVDAVAKQRKRISRLDLDNMSKIGRRPVCGQRLFFLAHEALEIEPHLGSKRSSSGLEHREFVNDRSETAEKNKS